MTHDFNGDSVEQILTRGEAAEILGVKPRQIFEYIEAGSLFLEPLKRFRNEDGGINRKVHLTNWDIPILQKIQFQFRKNGKALTRQHMNDHPDYYLID